jgi:hypothetical protein
MTRSTQHDHAALAATLTRQYQVISRSQVMAHGMTTSALRQRLRAGGPWQRLLPGVFLAVTGTPTTEQRSMAALLYAGTGGMITGGFGGAAAGDAGRVVAVPGVPHHDQGADEQGERDGALDGAAGAGAGLAGAQDVAGVGEGLLDGLITNGKFCCVRWVRLSLSWWHRPLRLRESALQRCRPGRRAR